MDNKLNKVNDQPKDNLAIRFRKLCKIIAIVNARTKAILSSSMEGIEITRLIVAIGKDLERRSTVLSALSFNSHYSRGKGCLPRILYLSFTKTGYPNANISVTVCFDLMGKGAVMGLMESKERPTGKVNLVVRKSQEISPKIDVDGPKSSSTYNNMFSNPKEFFRDSFSSDEFIEHFDKNMTLLMELAD